ncbi:MAG: hypothetical protein IKN09_02090 [Clostridia bacterium]|nr:hypothetical protein [Clostridia bacterium]
MKRLLKISLIMSIMLAFCFNLSVFAAEDVNTLSETDKSSYTEDIESYTEITTNNSSEKTSAAQVTSVKQKDDQELSISDILNILLIATGFVIILLAIAIFIKIK